MGKHNHIAAHPIATMAVGLTAVYVLSRVAKRLHSPVIDRLADAVGEVLAMVVVARARSWIETHA